MTTKKLSHFDNDGQATMVDISAKEITQRIACARGEIHMRAETLTQINNEKIKKGNVLLVARIAAIQGAKRTAELIPLCHPLNLTHLSVDFSLEKDVPRIICVATAKTLGCTGAEMEALTAVNIALLTIYDMCKSIDRAMRIANIEVIEKHGGKSGSWQRGETN